MRDLETYFELAKLKFQVFELCHEELDTEGESAKKKLLIRLASLIENSGLGEKSILKQQVDSYISNFKENQLFKNESFKKELSNIIAIIDELRIIYYRMEVDVENTVFKEQLDRVREDFKELEHRLKNDAFILQSYFKSRLGVIQLAILLFLILFAFTGIVQIKDYKVNLEEISKEKVEEAQKQIDIATQKTRSEIDNLDKEYKSALVDLINNNTSQYEVETEEYISSEKERIRTLINSYISELKATSKPNIDEALGNFQITIGSYNERINKLDESIINYEETLNNLNSQITTIKRNLIAIDTTLSRFESSPTLNVVGKISTVLNQTKLLIWIYAGMLLLILVWNIFLSIRLRKL